MVARGRLSFESTGVFGYSDAVRARRSIAAGVVVKRFLCDRCGFTSNARIRALGIGSALTREGAADRADDELTNDALRTLELTPCPRCGHRHRSLRGVLISTAAIVAVVGAPLWLIARLSEDGAPVWFEIAAIAGLALFAIVRLRRALLAARRVELVDS